MTAAEQAPTGAPPVPSRHDHPPTHGVDGGPPVEEHRRGSYAGFASRTISFTVDALVVAGILSMGATVSGALIAALNLENKLGDLGSALLVSAATGAVILIYNTAALWLFGRTAGMMVMGLRVVRADGRNPGLIRAAVRTAATLLSTFFMLGFAWIAVDNRRQAWHDKIAHTFVVYDWNAQAQGIGRTTHTEPLPPHG